MTVLIAAPIAPGKQYSMQAWLTWIATQEYKNFDVMMCVNGEGSNTLIRKLKSVVMRINGEEKRLKIISITPQQKITTMQRIGYAREALRRAAIAGQYSHIFFLDTDVIPYKKDALSLLMKKDVMSVTGLYFYKQSKVPIMVDAKTKTNFTIERCTELAENREVAKTVVYGLGCTLISRTLFTGPFTFEPKDWGAEVGEDYGWCYQLDKAGIISWFCPEVICQHMGKVFSQKGGKLHIVGK